MHTLQATFAVIGAGAIATVVYARTINIHFHTRQRGVDERVYLFLTAIWASAMAIAQYFFF